MRKIFVSGSTGKRTITLIFSIIVEVEFLLVQIIYACKTRKSTPRVAYQIISVYAKNTMVMRKNLSIY